MSLFKFKDEDKRIVLNKDQEYLRTIDGLIGNAIRAEAPAEVTRLQAARADVASRLTAEQISEYEASRIVVKSAAQKAAELAEMNANKDKNPI